jgi:hypothetical protein
MDRDFLVMLMEYILAQQDRKGRSREEQSREGGGASPYAPPLTSYVDDYWELVGQNVAAENTTGASSIGDPDANSSEVDTINGEPYIPEEFMRDHSYWMDFSTPQGIYGAPQSPSNNVTPGVSPPRIWEDGSVTPAGEGDTSPDVQTQLISGPFRQYPIQSRPPSGRPRGGLISEAMAALQAAFAQAQANGNRPPSRGVNLQYSSDADPIPNPFGGRAPIPHGAIPSRASKPDAPMQGLFGAPAGEEKDRTVSHSRDPKARGNRAETPPRTGMLPNGRAFPGVGPNGPASTVRQNAAPQGNALPAARRIVNAASQQKSWTPAPAFRAPSPRPAPAPYNPPAAQARNTYNPPAAPALRAALSALTRRR